MATDLSQSEALFSPTSRLVIVSNRLPIVLQKDEEDNFTIRSGSGGLVTALAPVLKNRGGIWIGWPGITDKTNEEIEELINQPNKNLGYDLKSVSITNEERELYYNGFSNEVIWPLFHDFPAYYRFEPKYWQTYQAVNRKFAEVIEKNVCPLDYVWVHDYQLINVASSLRDLGNKCKIGYFLHIPFPSLDIFIKLPWRSQLLKNFLAYDLIGFQTLRDRRNFLQCIKTLIPEIKISGKGPVVTIKYNDRNIRVGAFPISIDYTTFVKQSQSTEVSDMLKDLTKDFAGQKIILGIDRLDYTKGIIERFRAFKIFLERYPEFHKKVTLVQIAVPSREDVKLYMELKLNIERLVGEINGKYTQPNWVPIHYIFRSIKKVELLSYYRMAEVALITPLKDGMNLVAKEYCACNSNNDGAIILSEFAGAIAQLQRGAIVVNPFDTEGIAEAIYRALTMNSVEKKVRMSKMRRTIKRSNVFTWLDSFLVAALSKNISDFPILEDYVPTIDMDYSFSELT